MGIEKELPLLQIDTQLCSSPTTKLHLRGKNATPILKLNKT